MYRFVSFFTESEKKKCGLRNQGKAFSSIRSLSIHLNFAFTILKFVEVRYFGAGFIVWSVDRIRASFIHENSIKYRLQKEVIKHGLSTGNI